MNELSSFFNLTFDRVLAAVEQAGRRTTGLCYALNSLENRVYDIELEDESRLIAKFYRPGRWAKSTILDEHKMLLALKDEEIPVAAPVTFPDGTTLHTSDEGIHFALFPRLGGRAPDEFSLIEYEQVGRLIGRIHNIGARLGLSNRPELTPVTYGKDALSIIIAQGQLSLSIERRYNDAATMLISKAEQLFDSVPLNPIHADFHRGNLLRDRDSFIVLDFDDMARGPAAQDLWLILPARLGDCPEEVAAIVRGYEQFRAFDVRLLNMVEALRGLRYLRYAGWIQNRSSDPAFKLAFPQFGSENYWEAQVADLYEQVRILGEN
ncbi:MAG: serine/threonine protein kinase [Deltaproteobacteria bacterium]|nr:serine/threonine protein kinase [Deltaproteobacteria bacterium]